MFLRCVYASGTPVNAFQTECCTLCFSSDAAKHRINGAFDPGGHVQEEDQTKMIASRSAWQIACAGFFPMSMCLASSVEIMQDTHSMRHIATAPHAKITGCFQRCCRCLALQWWARCFQVGRSKQRQDVHRTENQQDCRVKLHDLS